MPRGVKRIPEAADGSAGSPHPQKASRPETDGVAAALFSSQSLATLSSQPNDAAAMGDDDLPFVQVVARKREAALQGLPVPVETLKAALKGVIRTVMEANQSITKKSLRQALEDQFNVKLSVHKDALDILTNECSNELDAEANPPSPPAKRKTTKKDAALTQPTADGANVPESPEPSPPAKAVSKRIAKAKTVMPPPATIAPVTDVPAATTATNSVNAAASNTDPKPAAPAKPAKRSMKTIQDIAESGPSPPASLKQIAPTVLVQPYPEFATPASSPAVAPAALPPSPIALVSAPTAAVAKTKAPRGSTGKKAPAAPAPAPANLLQLSTARSSTGSGSGAQAPIDVNALMQDILGLLGGIPTRPFDAAVARKALLAVSAVSLAAAQTLNAAAAGAAYP